MRKLMLLAAGLAVALLAAAPAIAQEAKIEGGPSADAKMGEAKAAPGVEAKPGEAKAGGAEAKACPPEGGEAVAKAGGAEAKSPCPPPPPPPPPKGEMTMPKTGGIAPTSGITAGLWGLGATALIVGGGLLARRMFAR